MLNSDFSDFRNNMVGTCLHFLINFHKKNLQFAIQLLLQLLSLLHKAEFEKRKRDLIYVI